MKHLLVTAAILALSAGMSAAEITLSGDARMGVIDDFGPDNTGFTSRARVKFTLSGETDGGLSFGASFRMNDAADANIGDAGEVFISGAFGKLTMGDVDGAAEQAVGNVSGVGLTGLGDLNEAFYIHDAGAEGIADPSAAYEYSTGAFSGFLSITNPLEDGYSVLGLGAKYAAGNYTVAIGYEFANSYFAAGVDWEQVIIGASATFGAVTLKADYGELSTFAGSNSQWHVSADYVTGALTMTAFVGEYGSDVYGLGAAYDLGGGASLVGGYAAADDGFSDVSAFDLGLSFEF